MLNQLQQVTLISFLRALVELDSPLPAQLQREIKCGLFVLGAKRTADYRCKRGYEYGSTRG